MWQAYQQMSTRNITHYADILLYLKSEILSIVMDSLGTHHLLMKVHRSVRTNSIL